MTTLIQPHRPHRNPAGDPLGALRHRLLTDWLRRHGAEAPGRLPALAAVEAEALAWQTPVPLLVLPALLEEKLEAVRTYRRRQARAPAPPALREA